MEIKTLDFLVGLSVGAVLGVGGTWWSIGSGIGWGTPRSAGCARENRSLKRRLAEKDRHIGRMLPRRSAWRSAWGR